MPDETVQLGNVISAPPRAVQVRNDPSNVKVTHSAVSTNLIVLTDNRLETQTIMAQWPRVVAAVKDRIDQIVAEIVPEPEHPEMNLKDVLAGEQPRPGEELI